MSVSKHVRYYDFSMDALLTVCSRNTKVIMVWAWMPWLSHAFEIQALL